MKKPPESVTAVISTEEPSAGIAAAARAQPGDRHAHQRGEHQVEDHGERHHAAERQLPYSR